jgi:hypothetical protein
VNELPWTKARPSQPGWYWFRKPAFSPDVYTVDESGRVSYRGVVKMGPLTDRWFQEGEWSGPYNSLPPETERRERRDRRMGERRSCTAVQWTGVERRNAHRRTGPRRGQDTSGGLQRNTVTRI